MFKNVMILMLLGAVLGATAASFIVPPALSWYAEPGGLPKGAQIQAVVNIQEVIRYATSKLIFWQSVSAAIGSVVGLVAGVLFSPKRRPAVAPVATGETR